MLFSVMRWVCPYFVLYDFFSFLIFSPLLFRSWENNPEHLFSLLFVPMPQQQWSLLGGLSTCHLGAMETRNRVLDHNELRFIPWECY